MSAAQKDLPRWLDVGVIPLINLLIALFVAGIVGLWWVKARRR
jgi:hypothetical protein